MADQLWTDKKIENVSAPGVIAGNGGRFVNLRIVTDMRNDYERALAFRNEDIGNLRNELSKALARVAELAAQWEPVAMEIFNLSNGKELLVHEDGESFSIGEGGETIWLPGGLRIMRKVQP